MVDINVSDDLELGVAFYETQNFRRGENIGPDSNGFKTVVRVVADALTATARLKEFTVVKLNDDMEVDVYTFTDYENGVKPFGLTGTSMDEGTVGGTMPIITTGRFNADRMIFDASFDTLAKKLNAFNFPGSNIQLVEFLYQGIE